MHAGQEQPLIESNFHQMYCSSGCLKIEYNLLGCSLSGIDFAFVIEVQTNFGQEFQKQPASDSVIALLGAGSC